MSEDTYPGRYFSQPDDGSESECERDRRQVGQPEHGWRYVLDEYHHPLDDTPPVVYPSMQDRVLEAVIREQNAHPWMGDTKSLALWLHHFDELLVAAKVQVTAGNEKLVKKYIVELAAMCVASLEQHGIVERENDGRSISE